MGLPGYLKDKLRRHEYDEFVMTYWAIEDIRRLLKYFNPDSKSSTPDLITFSIHKPLRSIPLNVLKESTIRYGFRKMYKTAPCILRDTSGDYIKVGMKCFTGWVKEDQWIWTYKTLPVNSYFYEFAQKHSDMRRDREKELIDMKEELERIKTIEQGRVYRDRLRFMIMQRDGNRCVICGRRADEVSLEVDHIVPWSEGGKTTYDNGQTLCAECNKAKHHTRLYQRKSDEFNSGLNPDRQ